MYLPNDNNLRVATSDNRRCNLT